MELREPGNLADVQESVAEVESGIASVSLFLRPWAYGGPAEPLSGLALEEEPQIKELILGVIHEANGVIAESQHPKFFVARFTNAVRALSAAKAVQQRFLTFHRDTEPQQIVSSILICPIKNEEANGLSVDTENILANLSSAQILIAGSVYTTVYGVPGFQFSAKPVREAGQTGDPEAIYELLWTDESTDGHLRQAIQSRLNPIGRYQIQEELGRGAMGVVYKAYDQLIGRTVALKAFSIDRNTPEGVEMIERLKQEAKAAGKLDHPNIITIYDVGQEDDLVYLSMQFLEGKTLLKLLAEDGVPSLPTLISWADQISSAVGYAHAHGVIHRDLKPANLMLTNQGIIKVLDFGIAKVESSSLTQTGLVVGTPSHMAPEQVAGKKVDHRADIFALGSVLYELVTREKPFRGDITTILYKIVYEDPVAPSLINPALPGGIDAIIRKALTKDPDERFQSCGEMRNAFLEQAAYLNITLAPSLPASTLVSSSIARPSATFSLHLLEDTYVEPSRRIWRSLVAFFALGMVATGTWAVFNSSRKGCVPKLVKRLEASAYSTWQQLLSKRIQEPVSSGEQPRSATSERAVESTTKGEQTRVGPDSPPLGSAVPENAQPASLPAALRTGASASAVPTLAAEKAVRGQSSSDGSQSSTLQPPVASMPDATQAPHQPSASDQLAGGRSSAVTQQNDKEQASTQDGSKASEPPAEQDSAKAPATSDTSDEALSSSQPGALAKKPRQEPVLVIDGFTRHDVPELLRQAEAAARRGDYRLARYEYKLILKLDPANALARTELRHLQPAEEWH